MAAKSHTHKKNNPHSYCVQASKDFTKQHLKGAHGWDFVYLFWWWWCWQVLTDALGCGCERQLLQQQSHSCSFCPHTHLQCFSVRHASKEAAAPPKKRAAFSLVALQENETKKSCLIQQNDEENQQRWDGVVTTAAALKRRGVALEGSCESYSAGTGFSFFFFVGVSPFAIVFQSKAHLYMLWYGLRNHANSVGVV